MEAKVERRKVTVRMTEEVYEALAVIAAEMGFTPKSGVQNVIIYASNMFIKRYRPATGKSRKELHKDPFEGLVCIEPSCTDGELEIPFKDCKSKQLHDPVERKG